jgi:hypothetical protein
MSLKEEENINNDSIEVNKSLDDIANTIKKTQEVVNEIKKRLGIED